MAPVRLLSRFAVGLVLAALVLASPSHARVSQELREVPASSLPREAREVLAAIHAGGPFRYERDGITFGNREKLLPAKPRGYYHEYTVRTPGARDRGARRIVCGGPQRAPSECYYSDDHYNSFRRIVE